MSPRQGGPGASRALGEAGAGALTRRLPQGPVLHVQHHQQDAPSQRGCRYEGDDKRERLDCKLKVILLELNRVVSSMVDFVVI